MILLNFPSSMTGKSKLINTYDNIYYPTRPRNPNSITIATVTKTYTFINTIRAMINFNAASTCRLPDEASNGTRFSSMRVDYRSIKPNIPRRKKYNCNVPIRRKYQIVIYGRNTENVISQNGINTIVLIQFQILFKVIRTDRNTNHYITLNFFVQ